ncbi:MAG: transglutaminaseTgpA domain-containing protein, partial [Antricoccus sp.]
MKAARSDALLSILAAAATAATTWTFNSLFLSAAWIIAPLLVIALVGIIGITCRAIPALTRATVVVQLLFGVGLILVLFTHHSSLFGFIPTTDSFHTLGQLISEGTATAQNKVAPIIPTAGTTFLLTISTLPIAVLVDECAFTNRPAMAGLALLALFAIATAVDKRTISAPYVALAAITYFTLVIAARVLQRQKTQQAGQLGAFAGVTGTAAACIVALVGGLIVPSLFTLPKGGLVGSSETRSPGPQVARSTDLAGQLKL